MTELERMTEHLMRFVKVGSRQYAVQAALDYEAMDPFQMTGLSDKLAVEISRWRQERANEAGRKGGREPGADRVGA